MKNIHESVYIAEGAVLAGENINIGEDSSIWFNAVVRADYDSSVNIGDRTNIQDLCMLHTSPGTPVDIGSDVTVGHSCIIHSCTIGDNTLIGMGSIVMNKSVIGKNCIIGAGSLITEGKTIPDGSMAFGRPAKVVRELTAEEIERVKRTAGLYVREAAEYLEKSR